MRLTFSQSRGLSCTICFSSSIARAKSPFFSAASASAFSLIGLSFFGATSRASSREEPALGDVAEGAAVDRRGPEAPQRQAVLLAPVAHVAREVVAGVLAVERAHQRVAQHLGHDRGRRDR